MDKHETGVVWVGWSPFQKFELRRENNFPAGKGNEDKKDGHVIVVQRQMPAVMEQQQQQPKKEVKKENEVKE